MKYSAKTILFIIATFIVTGFSYETKAVDYIEGSRCPKAPDPTLASICGYVKSSIPLEETQHDGSTILIERKGLEGVTAALYECDNKFDSCKDNGFIVHPFSSTYSDIDGNFHLTTRRVDDLVTLTDSKYGDIEGASRPSKRRYLIFTCGAKFAGLLILPSYADMTHISHEVKCPEFSVYREPLNEFTIVNDAAQLATHMGSDEMGAAVDPNGASSIDPNYIPYLSSQMVYEDNPAYQNVNMDLKLIGADPRFTIQSGNPTDYIDETNGIAIAALQDFLGFESGHIKVPEKGAFWAGDCLWKYKDKPDIRIYCMGNEEGYAAVINPVTRQLLIEKYEARLYGLLEDPTDPNYIDFVVQNKLPNIPPKKSILFYKELPARQDMFEFITDQTRFAGFNGSLFSNCIGEVFQRLDFKDKEDPYPLCSIFQECNKTINNDNSVNSLTTSGPAKGFADPLTFKDKFEQDVDLNTVVCKDDSGSLIMIKDIQPHWVTDSSQYKLDRSYWNSEFMYNWGINNKAGAYSLAFQNKSDSRYADKYAINERAFMSQKEAAGFPGDPIQGGTKVWWQNSMKTPNNNWLAAVEYTKDPETGNTKNSLSNLFTSPLKDDAYERGITSGIPVGTVGPSIHKLGEYSSTNVVGGVGVETIDVTAAQDEPIYENIKSKSGPTTHYPFIDFYTGGFIAKLFGIEKEIPSSLEDAGVRTNTTANHMTSAGIQRYKILRDTFTNAMGKTVSWKCGLCDFYDSFLSLFYGYGKLDFKDPLMPDSFDALKKLYSKAAWDEIVGGALSLLGIVGDVPDKTYYDRTNAKNLNEPDALDALKAEFLFSELAFLEEFPLPVVNKISPSGGAVWLFPEDWGGRSGEAVACYPWEQKSLNEKCDTLPESPNGQKDEDGISRTCRMDKCLRTTTEVPCKCNEVDFSVDCSPYDVHKTNVLLSDEDCTRTVDTFDRDQRRFVIAQRQTTCISGGSKSLEGPLTDAADTERDEEAEIDCLQNLYTDRINQAFEELELNDKWQYCNSTKFTDSRNQQEVVTVHKTIQTPQGIVSMAGPYKCTGEIGQNSELEIRSQPVNPSHPSESIDTIRVAGNEMSQTFSTPTCTKFVYSNSAFTSASSSVRTIKISDIAKRVDTLVAPGGDLQTPSILRDTFGTPATTTSPKFNPIFYHCLNPLLGGSGIWECKINKVPNPEIADIQSLSTKRGCSLNPSLECNNLVFGSDYYGGQTPNVPACLKPYYPVFPKYSDSGNFSELFVKVISAAASKYDIPASVLMAYMSGIGQLTSSNLYYFSKAGEVDFFGVTAPWYGILPQCDDMATAAQGPFDWLNYWFNFTLTTKAISPNAREALNEISANRGNTASRCNFLDAAYTAASAIAVYNKGCSNSWESYSEALQSMTFGSDRKGVYATDPTYGSGSPASMIFEACR